MWGDGLPAMEEYIKWQASEGVPIGRVLVLCAGNDLKDGPTACQERLDIIQQNCGATVWSVVPEGSYEAEDPGPLSSANVPSAAGADTWSD